MAAKEKKAKSTPKVEKKPEKAVVKKIAKPKPTPKSESTTADVKLKRSKNALNVKYIKEVRLELKKMFGFSSDMQIPKIKKIVLNMTVGNDVTNSKAIIAVEEDLTKISGQKPLRTHAKKSLASFKLREGMPIGAKVTLRRDKMWDFLQKLINVVLPRSRDFRGTSLNSFDSEGNYALGVAEQIIFPEIEFDKVDKIRGLDVIIVMSSKNKDENKALLELLGMPFRKVGNN